MHNNSQITKLFNDIYAVPRDKIIILNEKYDENQLWFQFGSVFIFQKNIKTSCVYNEEYNRSIEKYIKKKKSNKFYDILNEYKIMYRYIKGIPQYTLPFKEYQRVSKSHYTSLATTDFPCWDRDKDGNILIVKFNRKNISQIKEWCYDNCQGKYVITKSHVILEKENDYILTKLRWSNGSVQIYMFHMDTIQISDDL